MSENVGQEAEAYIKLKFAELTDPGARERLLGDQRKSGAPGEEATRAVTRCYEFTKIRESLIAAFQKKIGASNCTMAGVMATLENHPFLVSKECIGEKAKCDISLMDVPYSRRFVFRDAAGRSRTLTVRSDFEPVVLYLHTVLQFDIVAKAYLKKHGEGGIGYLMALWHEARRHMDAFSTI